MLWSLLRARRACTGDAKAANARPSRRDVGVGVGVGRAAGCGATALAACSSTRPLPRLRLTPASNRSRVSSSTTLIDALRARAFIAMRDSSRPPALDGVGRRRGSCLSARARRRVLRTRGSRRPRASRQHPVAPGHRLRARSRRAEPENTPSPARPPRARSPSARRRPPRRAHATQKQNKGKDDETPAGGLKKQLARAYRLCR